LRISWLLEEGRFARALLNWRTTWFTGTLKFTVATSDSIAESFNNKLYDCGLQGHPPFRNHFTDL